MWKWSKETRCGFVIWHTSTEYILRKNYLQKIRRRENRLRNDGETSNDGDASTGRMWPAGRTLPGLDVRYTIRTFVTNILLARSQNLFNKILVTFWKTHLSPKKYVFSLRWPRQDWGFGGNGISSTDMTEQ